MIFTNSNFFLNLAQVFHKEIFLSTVYFQDLARPVRQSNISELQVFPTLTPSPSSDPRDASSREPEEEELPEDTRSKMSYLCINIFFVVIINMKPGKWNNID